MINKINISIFYILAIIMLVFPTEFILVKKILIFSLVISNIFTIFNERREIKKENGKIIIGQTGCEISIKILIWTLIYVLAGLFFTFIASLNRSNDVFVFFNVYVVNPAIFFMAITTVPVKKIIKIMKNTIWISTFIIVSYNLLYIIKLNFNLKILPSNMFLFFNENIGGVDIGIKKFVNENISSLIFLMPIVITLFILDKKYRGKFNIAILIMGFISVIASMRSILVIVVCGTPLIVLIIMYKYKINLDINLKKIILVIGAIVLILSIIFKINFLEILKDIISSFSAKSAVNNMGIVDNGGSIRYDQVKDLLYTWKYKPILGWGDGANSINVIRSDVSSGMYEMTYFAMLMQRGIIGTSLFFYQIFWILKNLINIVKEKEDEFIFKLSVGIGFSMIILATATNPYIYSFDRIIMIYYPLILIGLNNQVKKGCNNEGNNFSRWIRNKIISSYKGNVKTNDSNI